MRKRALILFAIAAVLLAVSVLGGAAAEAVEAAPSEEKQEN